MTEIVSDDITQVLSTVVSLYPGEDSEANEQKLTVTAMALVALCHSFDIEKDRLLSQVSACYDRMDEIETRPLLDVNRLHS